MLDQQRPIPMRTEILDTQQLTPSTHMIRAAKPEEFSFLASQSAALMIDKGYGIQRHAMSIASSPTKDYLEWATRSSDSDFKKTFLALEAGDDIAFMGPKGHFLLEPERPSVFLAGGIGITPFRSMLEFMEDEGLENSVRLLYANRSANDIPFKEQLDQLSEKLPGFQIEYFLSDPSASAKWNFRSGRIDEELLREIVIDKTEANYFVAGPAGMVISLTQTLANIGISEDRIRQERFRGYD